MRAAVRAGVDDAVKRLQDTPSSSLDQPFICHDTLRAAERNSAGKADTTGELLRSARDIIVPSVVEHVERVLVTRGQSRKRRRSADVSMNMTLLVFISHGCTARAARNHYVVGVNQSDGTYRALRRPRESVQHRTHRAAA